MPLFLLILIAVLLWLALSVIAMNNKLVRKKNAVDNAFGGIDAQLKKRYDVIPNLVATVQQYAEHEKEILSDLTAMRAKAVGGTLNDSEKMVLDNDITSSLQRVLVSVENYPDLKASDNFLHLQRVLNEVEAQVSAARRAYNAAVTDYNNAIESFPTSIMADRMNLQPKEVLAIPEAERENADVHNLFKR